MKNRNEIKERQSFIYFSLQYIIYLYSKYKNSNTIDSPITFHFVPWKQHKEIQDKSVKYIYKDQVWMGAKTTATARATKLSNHSFSTKFHHFYYYFHFSFFFCFAAFFSEFRSIYHTDCNSHVHNNSIHRNIVSALCYLLERKS